MENLFTAAYRCIMLCDPGEKVDQTRLVVQRWREGRLTAESDEPPKSIEIPGRPEKPVLVNPRVLPRRSFHTPEGRAALLHAITHIEFNAINLALDAVYRFRDLPLEYYSDWFKVADEEAQHFTLLFQSIYDDLSVDVLNVILKEEVGHVEIGSRWFHWFCDQRGLPREKTYLDLMQQYAQGRVKPPLDREARRAAGFTEQELQYLEGLL
ncbi:MAG: ferritin-like domain-containing protein [Gammaproteobacteria bacterium]